MFKPTPDTTFQQLIDQMMLAFCEAYTMCCNGEPRRVIIETDHPHPDGTTDWGYYYMLDFTNDDGTPMLDKDNQRIVCWACDNNEYGEDAATYTQAIKLLEDIAQKEQKHITEVYVESF